MKTFSDIAQAKGVSKRAVQGWWAKAKASPDEGGLGLVLGEISGGARRFTDDEVEQLTSYSSNRAAPQVYVDESALPEDVEVLPVAANDFDMGVALSNLDGAAGLAFEDSEQVVDVLEALCNQVLGGLANKVERQEAALAADRRQLFRAEAIAIEFDRRAARFGQRAKSVAAEQGEVTADIQQTTERIVVLGRPKQEKPTPSTKEKTP